MTYTAHQLQQGTPEWDAHRLIHFNASEAAAMLGISPYLSRSDLLKQKATGIAPEVSPEKQRLFARGHAIEAAARPRAELELGDLYPMTASLEVDGLPLSASFDGVTIDDTKTWECKMMNQTLANALGQGFIPDGYKPQLEQGLMIVGAEKALFTAGTEDGEGELSTWYYSDPELRAKIVAGWKQFAIDLANYVPVEVIVPAVAAPQMGLPAVSIQVNGSIALVDNLDKFGTALTAYVARINKKPETDQDFADLEATVKALKAAEDALDAAETGALAQTESIDSMRKTVALYRETARTNRLLVANLVKAEKENRRIVIVSEAAAELIAHMRKLNERLGKPYMPTVAADFQGVIKGLKSLDSMKDKVASELARCKIESNATADRIQANIATLRELAGGHSFLFADTASIVLKANDDLTALVKSRIADHTAAEAAKEEATRERIRAEEQEKAEQKAREATEAEDALISSLWANARRIEFNSTPYINKAIVMFETAARDWASDPRPRVAAAVAEARAEMKAKLEAAQTTEDAAKVAAEAAKVERIVTAPDVTAQGAITRIVAMPELESPVQIVQRAAAPSREPTPTLSLGEISTRLGFNVTSAFLGTLGFEATTVRAAKLYHAEDFTAICQELITHIGEVQDQHEAATA